MRRISGWLLILGLIVAIVPFYYVGCARRPAEGKLQILFSGNMRGNPEPCG
jgi:hypothetical protein